MKLYKNHNDILKLKKELMSQNSTNSKSSGLSSKVYKFINKEHGNNFEVNVKNILEMKYQWKETNINRKFLYTEINIDDDNIILTDLEEKKIKINNQEIEFYINKEKDLIIKTGKKKKKKIIMKNNTQNNDNIIDLFGKNIKFNKVRDAEIDGIYENFNFEFNLNEVKIIYNNINEEENFKISVLEIKLNPKKIEELLLQLKRDKNIMEKYYNEKILCIGIVNSASVNQNILNDFLEDNNDINIIILGFKNSIFDGRDVKQFYDWKSIKKIDNLEKNFNGLKEEVKEIKKEVQDLKGEVNEIKKEVQDLKVDVQDLKVDVQDLKVDVQDLKVDLQDLKVNVKNIFEILNTFKNDFLKKKRKRRKESEK